MIDSTPVPTVVAPLTERLRKVFAPPTGDAKETAPTTISEVLLGAVSEELRIDWKVATDPLKVTAVPLSSTSSLKVWLSAVVRLPERTVVPPPPLVRLPIRMKLSPAIAVVPEKFSVRLNPPPSTPSTAKAGVDPDIVVLASRTTCSW